MILSDWPLGHDWNISTALADRPRVLRASNEQYNRRQSWLGGVGGAIHPPGRVLPRNWAKIGAAGQTSRRFLQLPGLLLSWYPCRSMLWCGFCWKYLFGTIFEKEKNIPFFYFWSNEYFKISISFSVPVNLVLTYFCLTPDIHIASEISCLRWQRIFNPLLIPFKSRNHILSENNHN